MCFVVTSGFDGGVLMFTKCVVVCLVIYLSIGRSTSQIFCPFCVQCGIACSLDHFKVGPGSLVLT